MRAVDIIEKKRDGQSLTRDEINWFIDAFTDETLPDYQASALLMAICIRGMTGQEITDLTMAMANSGERLDLSPIIGYAVDKHSSGGVGDKTSLVVLPLVASCGVPVAKMSGRGLGFSGGTLDKMESIAGFRVDLAEDEFIKLAKETGLVLSGQTRSLAPADGKLYALRDVTGTVPSIPLIASSIMSKKIAAGANGIVLDVKAGSGAFMKTVDDARDLARKMVEIGANLGRDMVALISDMNQPLGFAVGNALETAEAIETLHGGGPDDFRHHCLEVGAHMLRLAGQGERWTDLEANKALLQDHLQNGQALAKFRGMVVAQGGDAGMVDDPSRLPTARIVETVSARQTGYIAQVDALPVAQAALVLGAGREKKGDPIDLAVGVKVHVKVGDSIAQGAPLMTIYADDAGKVPAAVQRAESAIAYSANPVEPLALFYDTIYGD